MTTASTPTSGMNKARVGVQRFGTFLSGMIMPNIAAFIAWGFVTMLFILGGMARLVVPRRRPSRRLRQRRRDRLGGRDDGARRGPGGRDIPAVRRTRGTDGHLPAPAPHREHRRAHGLRRTRRRRRVDRHDGRHRRDEHPDVPRRDDHGPARGAGRASGWTGSGTARSSPASRCSSTTSRPASSACSSRSSASSCSAPRCSESAPSSAEPSAGSCRTTCCRSCRSSSSPRRCCSSTTPSTTACSRRWASSRPLETGKSILFLIEANPGPGVGLLLAFSFFGVGMAKASAPGAIIIQFFGGIHEIYFPYALSKPMTILALIAGGATGVTTNMLLNGGLAFPAAPGSIIAVTAAASSPAAGGIANLLGRLPLGAPRRDGDLPDRGDHPAGHAQARPRGGAGGRPRRRHRRDRGGQGPQFGCARRASGIDGQRRRGDPRGGGGVRRARDRGRDRRSSSQAASSRRSA